MRNETTERERENGRPAVYLYVYTRVRLNQKRADWRREKRPFIRKEYTTKGNVCVTTYLNGSRCCCRGVNMHIKNFSLPPEFNPAAAGPKCVLIYCPPLKWIIGGRAVVLCVAPMRHELSIFLRAQFDPCEYINIYTFFFARALRLFFLLLFF